MQGTLDPQKAGRFEAEGPAGAEGCSGLSCCFFVQLQTMQINANQCSTASLAHERLRRAAELPLSSRLLLQPLFEPCHSSLLQKFQVSSKNISRQESLARDVANPGGLAIIDVHLSSACCKPVMSLWMRKIRIGPMFWMQPVYSHVDTWVHSG